MSSRWIIRISVYTVICVAMLAYGLAEATFAQKRGVQRPPDAGSALGDQPDPRRMRPEGNARPPSVGDRRGGGNTRSQSRSGQNETSTKASKPKFINLLDSKDLSQFRGYAQEEIGEGWSYDSKSLYFDGSGGGDVITKEVYDDFDLQVEWKVADGANSGIMFRVSLGDDAPYISGPEYQVLDDTEHSDGKNGLTSAGSLYGMFAPNDKKKLRDVGSWNKTRIIVEGNKITHFLNLEKVLEIEIGSDEWKKALGDSKFKDWEKFAQNKEGHIAFQDHGNEVWFRNIRIKRLGSATDQHTASKSDDRRPARGSKWEQMQNSVSGGDKDAAPSVGKRSNNQRRSQPARGSKFQQMQNSVPGAGKGGKGDGGPDK